MSRDLDLQEALARVWNLEHAGKRTTSPSQVTIVWDDTKTFADFELRDAGGVIVTGTLQFQIADAAEPHVASTNESVIKSYMATAWNRQFPDQPTSEQTIRVEWVSATKAEIHVGDAKVVFGAAEWTSIRSFQPVISGPYRVPARPW